MGQAGTRVGTARFESGPARARYEHGTARQHEWWAVGRAWALDFTTWHEPGTTRAFLGPFWHGTLWHEARGLGTWAVPARPVATSTYAQTRIIQWISPEIS